MLNKHSMETVAGALAYAMGVEPPKHAAAANPELTAYVDAILQGGKVDRIFMYNPDAISQWVCQKYPEYVDQVNQYTDLHVPICSVMPSITPVNFATMYTGAAPAVHGIQEYVKPVLQIDTLFDAMVRAGKKCAIIADEKCSLSNIYLEREIDYIRTPNYWTTNAEAAKAILEDKYDFIVCYNGNYDFRQHRRGPESPEALAEIKSNNIAFAMFSEMIRRNWKRHNTLVGFAMDHGSHWETYYKEGQFRLGNHGSELEEDRNILHHYKIYKAEE